MKKPKILVTAFEPFGGECVNPALEAMKQMKEEIAGVSVIKLPIPTVYESSLALIHRAICEHQPDAVLSIGQAGGRSGITPERVAINLDDCSLPDNAGDVRIDRPIFADGNTAYFTTLPVKAMVQAMREKEIPAALSTTAGTYVCNHVMYGVLYYANREFPELRAGFVHVPYLPSQVQDKPGTPSLELSQIVAGLEASVEAIFTHAEDVHTIGGSTH